jgi:hypothetical protein
VSPLKTPARLSPITAVVHGEQPRYWFDHVIRYRITAFYAPVRDREI